MVCRDFKKERRIIPMKSLSKKSKKVIKKHLEKKGQTRHMVTPLWRYAPVSKQFIKVQGRQ